MVGMVERKSRRLALVVIVMEVELEDLKAQVLGTDYSRGKKAMQLQIGSIDLMAYNNSISWYSLKNESVIIFNSKYSERII